MSRRVAGTVLMVAVLLALLTGTLLLVPTAHQDALAPGSIPEFGGVGYRWAWGVSDGIVVTKSDMQSGRVWFRIERRIVWPIVFVEQALTLLLGGGLLTWVVRRERRRKTMAS